MDVIGKMLGTFQDPILINDQWLNKKTYFLFAVDTNILNHKIQNVMSWYFYSTERYKECYHNMPQALSKYPAWKVIQITVNGSNTTGEVKHLIHAYV